VNLYNPAVVLEFMLVVINPFLLNLAIKLTEKLMSKHKKAAGCSNIQTAQLNILQFHFTQFLMPVKVACCSVSTRLTTNAWGLVL
jgi:hypothetical protein